MIEKIRESIPESCTAEKNALGSGHIPPVEAVSCTSILLTIDTDGTYSRFRCIAATEMSQLLHNSLRSSVKMIMMSVVQSTRREVVGGLLHVSRL